MYSLSAVHRDSGATVSGYLDEESDTGAAGTTVKQAVSQRRLLLQEYATFVAAGQLTVFPDTFVSSPGGERLIVEYKKVPSTISTPKIVQAIQKTSEMLVFLVGRPGYTSDAFELIDEVRADGRKVMQALRELRASDAILDREEIAAEIEELAEEHKDATGGHALDGDSIRAFARFLASVPLTRPVLSTTPFGFIYAEWRGPEGRLFAVQFLPSGMAHYASFTPDPQHAGLKVRSFGSSPADTLRSVIAGVLEWASA